MRLHPTLAGSALVLALAAGCDPLPGPVPATGTVRLSAPQANALAELIRLEDRREFDSTRIAAAAASPDPVVRRYAALTAGRLHEKRAVPLLVPLLGDADTATAANAAFALGMLGDSGSVAALASLLQPGSVAARPTVAAAAVSALGRIPSGTSRVAVEGFLRSTPVDGAPADVVSAALLAVWRFPRPADASPILPWLASRDPELRWRAAYALTRRPDPRGSAALAALTGDPNALVRSFAVRGLTSALADSSGVGAPRALDLLLAALGDSALPVRVNAVRTLGTYRDARAVDALRRALLASDPHPAISAAESLGRMGTAAAAAAGDLGTAALDASRPVGLRTASLAALVAVAPAEARSVADRLAGDAGWRVRAAAGAAYASFGGDARARAEALVSDADPRVGGAVLGALVEAAGKDLSPLRDLLVRSLASADVQVRATAASGLGSLGDTASVPLLLDAYQRAQRDTIDDAALAAIDALGALKSSRASVSRTFFTRFPRSTDELARHHAAEAFGDTLGAAWAPLHPVETGRTADDYQRLVRGLVAPALASGHGPRVRFTTSRGDFDVELFAADAPLTVENFLRLARAGYFDGQEWPRVVANFVIQGGDPRGDTSGGPGYAIRDEIDRHPYLRGTVGMALSGPDTGGSQFFVAHSPQPHLDGGYTVFGRVVRGMDVVDRILQGDRIVRVREIR
jgi:cyclophilin family peptidyl-prolyl cis-trans isomerase/HEAT repeat protein